ncbi:outer membrane beta-barrel protein [Saccharicrinis aurantiacus]|uniref:outer membrane beta-barrel protein n=1 Tax=Saccharicrinis aurantiacus TaxID=1849719 RepID=UPI000838611F|nr:outer membrane beta-barrel protein [Saccharicrinis aurantiacus]
MKKLLLLICVLFCINAASQESKKLYYQLNIGTSLSIPSQSSVAASANSEGLGSKYYSDFGYFINSVVSLRSGERSGFTSGLNLIMINTEIDEELGVVTFKGSRHVSYLQVPLLFDFYLSKRISLSAGVYGGVLLSVKEKGIFYFYKAFYDKESLFAAIPKLCTAIPCLFMIIPRLLLTKSRFLLPYPNFTAPYLTFSALGDPNM